MISTRRKWTTRSIGYTLFAVLLVWIVFSDTDESLFMTGVSFFLGLCCGYVITELHYMTKY